SVTLSGNLATGSVPVPQGQTVTISVNGAVTSTTINDAAGDFSTSVTTSALPASTTAYTIAYSYGGNTNFNTASDTSTALTVNKASPTFTSLTKSQTISYGTASVTLSGNLAAGSVPVSQGQ